MGSAIQPSGVQMQLSSVLAHIDGAYAPNTLRAYRADFEEFIAFCARARYTALPAEPETIAEFINSVCQSGPSSASIRRKLVSIASIHRLSRNGDPTKDAEVKLAMRKMHRKLGRACDQAYGITATTLDKLLVSAGVGFRGLRDRALLMLAYDTMRRRSELVSLRIADIEPKPIGAVIRLRRSKTDQEAAGTWLHISAATYRAITAWLEAAELKEGFLLRGVMGNDTLTEQLGGGQIGRIYKRLAQLAGLPEKVVSDISGHSLRVGAAQDLLQNGASLPQIMAKGGWAKTDTVMRYVERTSVAAIHVSAHFG